MKKLLSIIVLGLLLSGNAYAEWSYVETISRADDNNKIKIYIDPETFKKDENYSYIWKLEDLTIPFKDIKSTAFHHQIDCKLTRSKTLQYIFYTGQMGTGMPKPFVRDTIKWTSYPPSSYMSNLIKGICNS
jgi:hypothetical protein